MMDRYAKLRGRLAASWDAQRVWERHVSKSVHVPLDVKVCDAMVTLRLASNSLFVARFPPWLLETRGSGGVT
jgi:hypothetical protein